MVGKLPSFWEHLFSVAFAVSFREWIIYRFKGRIICSIHPVLLVPIFPSYTPQKSNILTQRVMFFFDVFRFQGGLFFRLHVLFSRPFHYVWQKHKPRHVATKNKSWRLHSFELLHECSQNDLFHEVSPAPQVNQAVTFSSPNIGVTFITFELKGHVFTHHPKKVTFSQNCQAWDNYVSLLFWCEGQTQQLQVCSPKPVGYI